MTLQGQLCWSRSYRFHLVTDLAVFIPIVDGRTHLNVSPEKPGNGIVAPKKMKGRYHSLETLTCNQALFSSGRSGAEL